MKKKKCADGGTIRNIGNAAAAGLSFIPGLGPAAGGAVGLISNLIANSEAKRELNSTVVSATPGNYNYGGDIRLSNSTFQVKGSPNKVDGNKYNYGGSPVYLDHNEVVNKDYVYSNSLVNPLTSKTFAEDALPLTKAIATSEKNYDTISKTTAKWNDKSLKDLQFLQEAVATVTGKRNDSSNHAFGGTLLPTDKLANGGPLPWEGFDTTAFQNWYNSQPNVQKLKADNIYGPKTQTAFQQYGDRWAANLNMVNTGSGYARAPIMNNTNSNYTSTQPDSVVNPIPTRGLQFQENLPYAEGNMLNPAVPINERSYSATNPNATIPQLPADYTSQFTNHSAVDPATPLAKNNPYRVPFTVGDTLQGIEVASKFVNAFQPVEKEPTQQLNSPITRQTYDPSNNLYQNQRSYQNALNATQGPVQLRRAVAANLLGSKLNADNNVLSQYQTMNNNATTAYEDRLTQRQGTNIQLRQYANDTNSRNIAAKHGLIDNAFTSLGNFGEALNGKLASRDAINMLKLAYPEVSQRVLNSMSQDDILRLLKIKVG